MNLTLVLDFVGKKTKLRILAGRPIRGAPKVAIVVGTRGGSQDSIGSLYSAGTLRTSFGRKSHRFKCLTRVTLRTIICAGGIKVLETAHT